MENLERPDGSVATPVGWLLIMAGVTGAVIAASAETMTGMLLGFGMANLGFGLGVILLSLGYLVRAIWFLPGRDILASEGRPPPAASTQCSWCDRQLPARFRTCTSFDHDSLLKVAPKVIDPVCQQQLCQRGYAAVGDEAVIVEESQ
jgi:hypothetical protein